MNDTIASKTNNPITSRYWNQVLYLLGTALCVDGHPSKGKLEAFLDVTIELKFVIDPTVKIRRQTLRAWFDLYLEDLSRLEVLKNDDVFQSLLQDISISGHKVDILTSLVQIVIADGYYSDLAQTLTKKTVLLWYMPSNHIDDVIYVCADLMKSSVLTAKPQSIH